MGVFTVVFAGTQPLGSLALGAAAVPFGMPITLALAGGACLLVGLAAGRLNYDSR